MRLLLGVTFLSLLPGRLTADVPGLAVVASTLQPTSAAGASSGGESYCLYLGSDAARQDDEKGAGASRTLWLVHPVATGLWYAACADAGGCGAVGGPRLLLQAETWRQVPAAAQHVLDALGVDDPDLVLVSCRLDSGSLYVYFAAWRQADLAFFQQKLALLRAYIRGHDMDRVVPLGEIEKGRGTPTGGS